MILLLLFISFSYSFIIQTIEGEFGNNKRNYIIEKHEEYDNVFEIKTPSKILFQFVFNNNTKINIYDNKNKLISKLTIENQTDNFFIAKNSKDILMVNENEIQFIKDSNLKTKNILIDLKRIDDHFIFDILYCTLFIGSVLFHFILFSKNNKQLIPGSVPLNKGEF